MAAGVRVDVRDALIISACNTPGGPVYEWRNERESEVLNQAFVNSPKNNVMDAKHRGGVVGTYRASWVTRRQGNQHRIGFQIENFSDHAVFVEEDRSASFRYQRFSWSKWNGNIAWVGPGRRGQRNSHGEYRRGRLTGFRTGRHVLRNAVNAVGAQSGDWGPLAGV